MVTLYLNGPSRSAFRALGISFARRRPKALAANDNRGPTRRGADTTHTASPLDLYLRDGWSR